MEGPDFLEDTIQLQFLYYDGQEKQNRKGCKAVVETGGKWYSVNISILVGFSSGNSKTS